MTKPNLEKWTDEKLDKELSFARSSLNRNHRATKTWLDAIEKEIERRRRQHENSDIH